MNYSTLIKLFFGNKITENEKKMFFLSLKALSGYGMPMHKSIDIIYNAENNIKIKSILKEVLVKVINERKKVEDELYNFGFINRLEYTILIKCTDLKEAIEYILNLMDKNNGFEKMLMKVTFVPLLMWFGVWIGLYIAQPHLMEFIKFAKEMATISTTVAIELDIPFFVQSRMFNVYMAAGSGIFLITLIILYQYMYQLHTKYIYKLFPLKAYEDIGFQFNIMNQMYKSGVTTSLILREMYENIEPKGIKGMFQKIERELIMNKYSYPALIMYNFPSDIVSTFKVGETTNSLWDKMENLIEYVYVIYDGKLKFYTGILAKVNMYIMKVFLIYIAASIAILIMTAVLSLTSAT